MHWKDRLTEWIEKKFYYEDVGYEGDVDIWIKPKYKFLEKFLEYLRHDF